MRGNLSETLDGKSFVQKLRYQISVHPGRIELWNIGKWLVRDNPNKFRMGYRRMSETIDGRPIPIGAGSFLIEEKIGRGWSFMAKSADWNPRNANT